MNEDVFVVSFSSVDGIKWQIAENFDKANEIVSELTSIPKDGEDEILFNKTIGIHTIDIEHYLLSH